MVTNYATPTPNLLRVIMDSIVKGLETGLINTFPADSPCCAVDNIVDSFHGCF